MKTEQNEVSSIVEEQPQQQPKQKRLDVKNESSTTTIGNSENDHDGMTEWIDTTATTTIIYSIIYYQVCGRENG